MTGRDTEDRGGLRQEPEGTPTLLIVAALLATACIGTLLIGAAWVLLHQREVHLRPSRRFDEQGLRLQERVSGVLQEPFQIPHAQPTVREQQETALHQFGWIDRPRRIVHIPIEEAMGLVAAGRSPDGAGR